MKDATIDHIRQAAQQGLDATDLKGEAVLKVTEYDMPPAIFIHVKPSDENFSQFLLKIEGEDVGKYESGYFLYSHITNNVRIYINYYIIPKRVPKIW